MATSRQESRKRQRRVRSRKKPDLDAPSVIQEPAGPSIAFESLHLAPSDTAQAVDVAENATPRLGPVSWTGMLLGMTSAMVIFGLATDFALLFATHQAQDTANLSIAIGASFLALSVGVRFPHRFAVWFCTLTWRRFVRRGETSDLTRTMLGTPEVDRPLYWIVLSVISMAAGIIIALWPWGKSLSHVFFATMHTHFVWSDGPHALLKTLLVFFTGLVPLSILGLAMSCLHHLSCPYGRWDTKATAWLLIGAAVGVFFASVIGHGRANANLVMMVAAVPTLLGAVASASASAAPKPTGDQALGSQPELLPIWNDPWPRLLRVGIVAVGGCSAFCVAVWMIEFSTQSGQSAGSASLMLLSIGIGALGGCRIHRRYRHSIGSFGVACASAGILLAIHYVAVGLLITATGTLTRSLAVCTGVALGFALAAGRLTLLDRVASRSSTGNVMLARVLVCSALTVSVAVPVIIRSFGIGGAYLFIALLLLALGGALIVHESGYSARSRRVRLAAVCTCIGAVILLQQSQ